MLKAILTGWKNYILKSEVCEAAAITRAAICSSCPSARHGKLLAFLKDSLQEIEAHYCAECGCPLSAKIRSNDICPINKWQ
ncbi:hypothetical protein [uncultured Flavobacterium sp.]|uniref:hypothetical protein n=1 Tax=uncultured Flavobacterium sp. TaxID=165435 RepID=UPI002600B488|nr:hypothetical protein [uncultured Flavobacterium sp.]